MIVTKLVPASKGRTKVFIDEEYYFALYGKELHRYKIKDGQPVDEELVDRILSQVILRRAKSKALSLLKQQDRTIADLRNKLKLSYYREDIIEQVLEYLDGYHYIDDYRYSVQFITFKRSSLSMRQIRYKLMEKGVSADIIDQAMEEFDDNKEEEREVLKRVLEKKLRGKDVSLMERKDWNKIYQFLMNKGFSTSDIGSEIRVYQQED